MEGFYETYGKSAVRYAAAFLLGLAAGLCLAACLVLQNLPDYRGGTDSIGTDLDRCIEGERRTEADIREAQNAAGNLAASVEREGGYLAEGQRILAEVRTRQSPPEEGT